MNDLIWNAARHPHQTLGRDGNGTAYCSIGWHPKGPEAGRMRAREQALPVVSRNGTVFVPIRWLRSEFSFEIEEASRRMDMKRVIQLTHEKEIALDVLERQAPERESSA